MDISDSIFKFFSFNEHSLKNLSNLKIYCNHYSKFNDPFECWCVEKTGIPDPKKEWKRFDEVAKTWGFDSGHEVTKEHLFEYCSEFIHKYSMRVSDYVDSARISCFSQRADNLLMWSHYADGLRGFCVEFDRDALIEGSEYNANVYDVIYKDSPPIVDTMVYEVANDQIWYNEMAIEEEESKKKYLKNHTPDNFLPEYKKDLVKARELLFDLYFKMLCCKPEDWKYEEEVRLIYHTEKKVQMGEPFSFPGAAIKSIIIGEKASEVDKKSLINCTRKLGLEIPIMLATRDKGKYDVTINSINPHG